MIEAVKSILDDEFEVVGAVHDGLQLIKAEAKLEPDIGIIDISMPVMNGITAAGEIAKRGSSMKVIFLTVNEDYDFIKAAFETGGLAYVIKRQMASDLPSALKEVLSGRRYISPGCELLGELGSFNGLE